MSVKSNWFSNLFEVGQMFGPLVPQHLPRLESGCAPIWGSKPWQIAGGLSIN